MLDTLKILCVEDDEFALEQMASFLKKRAGKVFSAGDGLEGIRQFEIHKPDIVIADLLMPGMDGMEMLKRLKEEHKDMHAIVVTSVNSVDTVLETMDMGIDNYVIKPVEFDVLELKLNKIAAVIAAEQGDVKGSFDFLEDKRTMEDIIKKDFIKALKTYMGKGPKEITVQLIGDEIKVTVLGLMTVMEENLMKDLKNHQMVRQMRQIAYEAVTKEFCKNLKELLGTDMSCSRISVDLKRKLDQIVFTGR